LLISFAFTPIVSGCGRQKNSAIRVTAEKIKKKERGARQALAPAIAPMTPNLWAFVEANLLRRHNYLRTKTAP